MQKYISFTAALWLAFILFSYEMLTLKNVAIAQEYPGCFLITHLGAFLDLNNLCPNNSEQLGEPLVFSSLQFQPPIIGLKGAGVQGSVTNRSKKIVSLKVIYVQLVADSQVIASSDIPVETGNGLLPGESISFETAIASKNLEKVLEEKVKVEVIRYK